MKNKNYKNERILRKMKNMQKLFALLLAVVMVLSMAVTAFADGEDTTKPTPLTPVTTSGQITINNSASGTVYTIYRIFDLVKTNEDGKHVFVINEKWEAYAALEMQKPEEQRNFTVSNDYLKSVTFQLGENSDDAKLQAFANDVYNYANRLGNYANREGNVIAHDGQSEMLGNSGNYTTDKFYQYGYYIMVSTHRDVKNPKYSAFVLDNAVVTVREKNSKQASIEKQVQEDSLATNAETGWDSSNAAEIGQPVNFKIVVTLAAGTDRYVIEDNMGEFENIANLSYTWSRGTVKAEHLTYTEKKDNNGKTTGFTVTLSDNFRGMVEDGDTLTIHYTACLTADAVIAGDGNENSATLTYGQVKQADGNYTEGTTTEPATTTTYTYKLIVKKTNENGDPLTGAKFTLSLNNTKLKFTQDPVNTTNYIVNPNGNVEEIETTGDCIFSISGLDSEDDYVLEETYAPNPYILMDPQTVKLSHTNTEHQREITVVNLPGIDMPETGGMGTTILYAVGGIMVLAAVVLLVTKKRMSA